MKRFGSALIAVACRINQPESRKHAFRPLALFGQQVRRSLASIEPLRNAWHFATALRGEMYWRTYDQASTPSISQRTPIHGATAAAGRLHSLNGNSR